MSGAWRSATRRPPGRWSVWKYGWIVHHRVIDALERVRGHARGLLLDVGCGAKPFAEVFRGRVTYVGCDRAASPFPEDPRPEVLALAEMLPIRDGSIDTVFSISTLNYLPEPVRMLEEARRVLRRDGALIVEFVQMAPPDQPDDYFRFTRAGALELLRRASSRSSACRSAAYGRGSDSRRSIGSRAGIAGRPAS
jgi:ubiquinone/menaquinone biosynthesis C-methylase UbiE